MINRLSGNAYVAAGFWPPLTSPAAASSKPITPTRRTEKCPHSIRSGLSLGRKRDPGRGRSYRDTRHNRRAAASRFPAYISHDLLTCCRSALTPQTQTHDFFLACNGRAESRTRQVLISRQDAERDAMAPSATATQLERSPQPMRPKRCLLRAFVRQAQPYAAPVQAPLRGCRTNFFVSRSWAGIMPFRRLGVKFI